MASNLTQQTQAIKARLKSDFIQSHIPQKVMFMKLMTYNIFNGGGDRLPLILDVIKKENPDFLTLNEANTWVANDHRIFKQVAAALNLPYFDIALSGHGDYHVAVFSKYKLEYVQKLQLLERA